MIEEADQRASAEFARRATKAREAWDYKDRIVSDERLVFKLFLGVNSVSQY